MAYESPSLPVYFKVKRVITQRISDGTYPVGSKIPSEHELSREFGAHRLTVRHALTLLAQDGVLKRFRRRGTFVAKNQEKFEEIGLHGFFDDLLYHVGKFKTKKVQISNRKPPPAVADLYGLDRNQDRIKVIKRVRFLGETPAAFTVNYLPLSIGNRISRDDLYQMPLLQIFKEKLNIPLGEALQSLEASIADREIAEALDVSPGTQILLMQRTFFTKQEKPFDFVQTFYRGDRIRYFVRFRYNESDGSLQLTR
jgi:GntR family transcriptional regulator